MCAGGGGERLLLPLLALALAACGGGGTTTPGGDDGGDVQEDLALADGGGAEFEPAEVIIGPGEESTGEVEARWPDEDGGEVAIGEVTDDAGPVLPEGWECETEGGPGCACEENGDCLSGWCVATGDGKVCTKDCVEDCPAGWQCVAVSNTPPDIVYICIPKFTNLCRPCLTNQDCDQLGGTGGYCLPFPKGAGSFCGGNCKASSDCPQGYSCQKMEAGLAEPVWQCVPKFGECDCNPKAVKEAAATDCQVVNEAGSCPGERWCAAEGLTVCDGKVPELESCNDVDDDCDGGVDEELAKPCDVTNGYGKCLGTMLCSAGKWGDCDAKVPGAEKCDGLDNDCDDEIDESFPDLDQDGLADCVDEDDDGDGVLDWLDNCPTVPNPGQEDGDKNDKGDACEDDEDGDGFPKGVDNCPEVANPDQKDSDQDGIGDLCDDELDGDGVDNLADNCPELPNPLQEDFDLDLIGDLCDDDDDNDGVTDQGDCEPLNPDVFPGAVELCNGIDEDCNAEVDETFSDLGDPCDGPDGDDCQNGQMICAPDYLATVCGPEMVESVAENCLTPEDDDCDGVVNEGCSLTQATVTFAAAFLGAADAGLPEATLRPTGPLAELGATGATGDNAWQVTLGLPPAPGK